MFELLVIILFVWLSIKVFGLLLRLTWGAATVIAAVLSAIALPVLVIVLLFAGGIVLFLPVLLIAAALGILKAFC